MNLPVDFDKGFDSTRPTSEESEASSIELEERKGTCVTCVKVEFQKNIKKRTLVKRNLY